MSYFEKITYDNFIQWYPGLFEEINGELFFHDDFKIICDTPLIIIQMIADCEINPVKYTDSSFRYLSMPCDINDHDFKKELRVANVTVLPDEVCLKLYGYDINIYNHDREAITRRHTIKNIIQE